MVVSIWLYGEYIVRLFPGRSRCLRLFYYNMSAWTCLRFLGASSRIYSENDTVKNVQLSIMQ